MSHFRPARSVIQLHSYPFRCQTPTFTKIGEESKSIPNVATDEGIPAVGARVDGGSGAHNAFNDVESINGGACGCDLQFRQAADSTAVVRAKARRVVGFAVAVRLHGFEPSYKSRSGDKTRSLKGGIGSDPSSNQQQ